MPLRLTTLDGVSLTNEGRPIAAVLNRRLSVALLLILAVRGARGLTREAIIELLWPDNALKDPRHSLDQLLTVTRTLAGHSELFLGTSTLRLNGDIIHTDIDAFERARRDGRLEELAALYRAPFADGFSAGESQPLEEFIANAARTYATDHANALRALAEAAARLHAHAEAARWWRLLLETDRLDGGVALSLIASLAACNRTNDALRTARGYAALLRAERGREDADIARWVRRLENEQPRDTHGSTASSNSATPTPNGTPLAANTSTQAPLVFRSRSEEREARAQQMIGRVIAGRYRLDRVLRTGSIANVYLALDALGTRSHVELHILEQMVASCTPAEQLADVFHRVRTLSHPNIVPVFDAGSDGALRFIATAQRPDDSLDLKLRRERPLSIGNVLSVAHDIGAAFAFAHTRSVCHGDFRPRHVFLDTNAVIGAFGLAESINWGTQMEGSAVLTLGSTVYHSPEQLNGEVRVDARSDVYAIGCVVFEMLVGEPPFGGPGRPNRMLKLSQAAPDIRTLRETIPAGLAKVVQTCLARVAADRYESAVEFERELAQVRLSLQ